MLYLNAYIVGRAFGGREEGGWWYDVGTPVACIPIPTEFKKGHDYYMDKGTPVVHMCRDCDGSGQTACCDEECECQRSEYLTTPGYCHMVTCGCGQVPADCEAVSKLITQYEELLKDEAAPRHHEELRLAVEKRMGEHFPQERPHYE